jgi:hypothetical protein
VIEEVTMENPVLRPDTINALIFGADASYAVLAGMQVVAFAALPLPAAPDA